MVFPVARRALSPKTSTILTEPEYLGRSELAQFPNLAEASTFTAVWGEPLAMTKAEVRSAASLAALATFKAATAWLRFH